MSKPRILFLGQLPPPKHGASLMNSIALQIMEKHFCVDVVSLSLSSSLSSLGKFSIVKLSAFFSTFLNVLRLCIGKKYVFSYFALNLSGFAMWRDFFLVCLLRVFRIVPVYHLHGLGVKKLYSSFWGRVVVRFFFKNSFVICVSRSVAKDEFSGLNIKNVQVDYVYNGINIVPHKIRSSCEDESLRLVHMSNLRPSKGVFDFLVIVHELASEGVDVRGVVAGEFRSEEFRNKCLSYIAEKNLQRHIELLGEVDEERKGILFKKPCIFVYPTYNDSFGLVLLESMQYGNPVVAYDEGSIKEIVSDSKCGFVVAKGNISEMKIKILTLFENKGLHREFQDNAVKAVREVFDIRFFERDLLRILRKVLK